MGRARGIAGTPTAEGIQFGQVKAQGQNPKPYARNPESGWQLFCEGSGGVVVSAEMSNSLVHPEAKTQKKRSSQGRRVWPGRLVEDADGCIDLLESKL